ncbi:MAG: uracil-DNA glycosylase [Hyphomicrobiales bacterium]|nr:uracil-DNA glycosylase [Hyphomicrobiales bacterium]
MTHRDEPARDCALCPRLTTFRNANIDHEPGWHNAPVASFGPQNARLLIVGLAPGLRGANRTGRPFTGDYAGDLLYATLAKFGFSSGHFRADPQDGLALVDARITNAVRCVPPANKPLPVEIATCRSFLSATLAAMPQLTSLLALGRIAHESVLKAVGTPARLHPFAHNARHRLGSFTLYDSYHCSRYNTNTGRLTAPMFEAVFTAIRRDLAA